MSDLTGVCIGGDYLLPINVVDYRALAVMAFERGKEPWELMAELIRKEFGPPKMYVGIDLAEEEETIDLSCVAD